MSDFEIKNGVLEKYSGSGGDVIIPEGVTNIWAKAFYHCSGLKSVEIPTGVTSIGYSAFSGCSGLTSVKIPAGVTSIGDMAFYDCSGLKSVEIPESVTSIGDLVFSDCSGLKSVEIPTGVTSIGGGVFWGCSGLTSVRIPKGVTSIDDKAFEGCRGLKSVEIPESVTSIGDMAFCGCSGLTSVTIPAGVTSISSDAFRGCSGLTNVEIPAGVTNIGVDAFEHCSGLTSVTIPAGVMSIGRFAFYGCRGLTSVEIPESVTSIGMETFVGCKNLKEVIFEKKYPTLGIDIFDPHKPDFPSQDLQTTNNIPAVLINNFLPADIEKERPYLILFQTAKRWKQRVREDVTEKNADEIMKNITALIQKFPKLRKKAGWQAAEFALEYQVYILPETLRCLVDVLEEKSCAEAVKYLQKDPGLKIKLEDKQTEAAQMELLNPIEKVVRERWIFDDTTKKVCTEIADLVRSGTALPHYSGSGQTVSKEVLAFVIAAYARQTAGIKIYILEYKKRYMSFKVDKMADQVAAALNGEELITFLEKGIYRRWFGQTAFTFIPALARYADESRTAKLISKMQEWETWDGMGRKKRESIIIARGALMLNDSRSAMLHMEKAGQLDAYAKLRGTDAETLRDTVLADFGLNEDGRKLYDLGNNTVSAFVGHDLKVRLYDEAAGKEIKSLPKRGADPDRYSAASKDLTELKKNVKKVVKARNDRLFKDFLSGKTVSADKWKSAYLKNPVLYRVAELLVWSQGTASFTLNQDGPVKSDGTEYEITEKKIRVAHPMEMAPRRVKAWQQYFASHDLRQPFEQIWEPVIDPKMIRPDRYSGQKVSVFRFRNQEKHGIYFYDEGFHDDIYFSCSGCDLEGVCTEETARRHSIGPDETFTLGKFSIRKKYTRQVNHIVSLLDRWTVAGRMLKDDVSVRDYLDGFTAAQIMEFIRLTSENNCPNCAAMLLQYRQERYPEFDPMAEFTLE